MKLPVEIAYERWLAGEISYDDYRTQFADPVEAERAAARRQNAISRKRIN